MGYLDARATSKAHPMLKLFTQFHVAISLLGIAAGFVELRE
jgi:hypothetical protein